MSNVLTYNGRQYVLVRNHTWMYGYDVLVSGDNYPNVFSDTGFTIIGHPTDYSVDVNTDKTDMPLELAMELVKLAYPDYRPQWWDQLTDGNGLVLRYDFKMYLRINNQEVSKKWAY